MTERVTMARPAPTKVSGVILDWAGTAVDYGCFAPVNAFEQIFATRGIFPTTEEVRGPMGQAKREHIQIMLQGERLSQLWREKYGRDWTEADVDEMYEQFDELLFESLLDFVDVKPGVLDTVDMLRDRDIKIGSTTGYTPEMMKVVSDGAKAGGYAPDEYVTPACVGYGRPHPFMVFENMRRLNLGSEDEIIKVGDTISDIIEGKNAKVYSVGVIEGSSEMGLTEEEFESLTDDQKAHLSEDIRNRYLEAGADAVLQEVKDLKLLLN